VPSRLPPPTYKLKNRETLKWALEVGRSNLTRPLRSSSFEEDCPILHLLWPDIGARNPVPSMSQARLVWKSPLPHLPRARLVGRRPAQQVPWLGLGGLHANIVGCLPGIPCYKLLQGIQGIGCLQVPQYFQKLRGKQLIPCPLPTSTIVVPFQLLCAMNFSPWN
jgi:hypothetical protein